MKKTFFIFLLCLGMIEVMHSQTQNEFVLEKLSSTFNTIQSACKEDGHRLATVEFFTAIEDIEFETVANDRIVSIVYDEKRGSYILCLRGVDQDWRYIQIDISKNGFMQYPMEAIQIKNGEYLAYKLSPMYNIEESPLEEPTSITVYDEPNLKPEDRWHKETFVTANVAFSFAPQWSFGFCVGQVKHYGWFVSAMTNGSFTGMSNLTQVDTEGFLEDGHLPMYNGTKATDRLSVIAGGMMRVAKPLYVRVGVGYGVHNLCWQDKELNWYKIKEYSFQGVDVSAGMQAHLGGFVLSLEAVTTNFKTLEGKLGVGYVF